MLTLLDEVAGPLERGLYPHGRVLRLAVRCGKKQVRSSSNSRREEKEECRRFKKDVDAVGADSRPHLCLSRAMTDRWWRSSWHWVSPSTAKARGARPS